MLIAHVTLHVVTVGRFRLAQLVDIGTDALENTTFYEFILSGGA